MTLGIEVQKLKRTGYYPAFLAGAVAASAFPLANMLVRAETFTTLAGNPYDILMDANWKMIAMVNVLLSICGACMMYNTEYSDNGVQKMEVLPVRTGKLFAGKFIIAGLFLALMILIESAVLAGCALHWFPSRETDLWGMVKGAAFQWTAALPTVMLMLVIASLCKNMWVSLGTGVILVFTMSIFPQENLVLSLFPFNSPFQTLAAANETGQLLLFLCICGIETVLFALLEILSQKVRRYVQ